MVLASSVAYASSSSTTANLRRVTAVTLVGHGWGPGIGMGQWGAFGYAVRYHFGYERILNRYYGTTVSASIASTGQLSNPTVSVLIAENLDASNNVGYDPIVTAPTALMVSSQGGLPAIPTTSTTVPATSSTTTSTVPISTTITAPPTTTVPSSTSFGVPAGMAVDLHLMANGTWSAYESSSCSTVNTTGAPVAVGLVNPVISPSVPTSAAVSSLMVLCRHDGVDESLRGSVEAYDREGYERTLNLVPLESYLDGVVPSEASASWGNDGTTVGAPQGEAWGFQALEAQAVAARSFTMNYIESGGWNGYASICDTQACEVYTGANYETATTNAAVLNTTGEIRVIPTAPTMAVDTRYSASTGGFTAPSAFPAVKDLGDACVNPSNPLECNPNHLWRVTLTGAQIKKHYPAIGRLLTIHVSARNGYGAFGGRSVKVLLHGAKSSIRVSGDAFAEAMNLKSNWFAIASLRRFGETPTTSVTSTSTPTP
jgi:SpoIID/LytB domain protein